MSGHRDDPTGMGGCVCIELIASLCAQITECEREAPGFPMQSWVVAWIDALQADAVIRAAEHLVLHVPAQRGQT